MGINKIDVPNIEKQTRENKRIVKVNELEGRCAYFPLSDYHNIRIFKEHNGAKNIKKEIENRLYMALLLFDTVILHCADPLRSEIIYEILNENLNFIENGNISFVFSNSINNIKADYRRYIENKISKYEVNEFSSIDIDSLRQDHMSQEYYEKVITLLDKTPSILKKGKDGSGGFKELIKSDLDNNVELAIMGRSSYGRSHVRLMNLSLYQLLNLKYFDGEKICSVFENEKIQEFIEGWESGADIGTPFSRHTIVEQLRKEFSGGRNQEKVIDVIETRLSLLYSKLNCGNHQIIEFHPAIEKRSIYNWSFFETYLSEINENRKVFLTRGKVERIRNQGEEWELFRNEFLSCMAELESEVSVAQHSELKNMKPDCEMFLRLLGKHNIANKYSEIRDIIDSKS